MNESSESIVPPPPDHPQAGFLSRIVLFPFLPSLWRAAARKPTIWVLLPILGLALITNFALGAYRALGAKSALLDGARAYDEKFDPVVYEDGKVRVEGKRILRVDSPRVTMLVDPEETVSIDDITTPEYIVVREDVLLRKQAFAPVQRITLNELGSLLGPGPIRINGETLQAFIRRWGGLFQLGVLLLVGCFGALGDVITCPIYALIAGAIAFGIQGRALGLSFGGCFRIGLATSASTIVLALIVHLLPVHMPCCLGTLAWLVLMTVLSMVALAGIKRGAEAPASSSDQ